MSTTTSTLRLKRLVAGLSAALALVGVQAHAFAGSVDTVTSCYDDNSPGSLRQIVGNAASGDQIDLSQLSCKGNTLTLTQGELLVPHNASLIGPTNYALTIANSDGRVLHGVSTDSPGSYLQVVNLTISGGRVATKSDDAEGGCILAVGDLTLSGSTVSDCVASTSSGAARGGAVRAQSVTIQASTISGSDVHASASYQVARGGGIYTGSLSCTDSNLSGNQATATSTGDYGQGGGAFIAGGNAGFVRCTIDSNQAGNGAGIAQLSYSGSSSITTIQNSTITGNTAADSFGGFELSCPKCTPQSIAMSNSTVAFNSSSSATAGIFTTGDVVAQSSIVADNRSAQDGADADLFTGALSGANNLIVSTNATPTAGVITVSSDPMLSPLSDHGGLTRTLGLSTNSPARARGNDSDTQPTDQRGKGFSRTVDGSVDIGAYQRQVNEEVIFGGGFE